MQSVLPSLHIINLLQLTVLFLCTFFFEGETKCFSTYLNEDLKPQVKIETSSGHVVLSDMQLFIMVTLKCIIPKNEVREHSDPRHTLWMYCGRYISITSEKIQVCLSKNDCHN